MPKIIVVLVKRFSYESAHEQTDKQTNKQTHRPYNITSSANTGGKNNFNIL